ncbi:peptidoglycan-binding protein [Rhodosalinus halophilus]|uniref:Peptidoglycan-binding protein n=1 Tax=Rhodosalinus halophilus TaxID=2259333 RepID=A0A365UC38_9RHOB|nr:trypsin-like peptidase domain-containing protein [Rhodosalinus halophilus]RBI86980.1 peptidoglycan-binding protein [Rhodosalinus halophilus]
MRRLLGFFLFALALAAVPLRAQEGGVWVQIEAQPSLREAEERARLYAQRLPDVAGFSIGSGWYAIVLGPYTRATAEDVLASYRAAAEIPRDSFIALPGALGRQFWPVGASARAAAPIDLDPGEAVEAETPAAQPAPPDETPREARASEAQLTRAEREELQIALQWAGHYRGAIDAAFGRGTRGAMADWQRAAGYEPTGVLTTRQRAELLAQYNAVLEGLDLRMVTDDRAGIRMALPTGVVSFDRYEFPFAHYEATGEVPEARVLLISQPGDRDTLAGLYEIMQTLEIVPLDGPRERDAQSFTLEGRDDRIVSVTQAALEDGTVKGFTLVWPAGDEERRRRLLEEMRESFARLDGAALSPGDGSNAVQDIDLVAGLAVRQPVRARSGFYVDGQGAVLTTTEAVAGCTRVTLDDGYEAQVAARDDALGVALLRPEARLAPMQVAEFATRPPRLKSEVAVAGYSFGGRLPAPTLTFGQLEELTGLAGEDDLNRLSLDSRPGDTGGPVFDAAGAVVGLLLPRAEDAARRLPDDVRFAARADALRAVIEGAGLVPGTAAPQSAPVPPEDLTTRARGMTVLVNCWD